MKWFSMVLDFAFIFFILTGLTGCSYNETDEVLSWTESAEKCALATPDITLDSEGYRANIKDEDWSGQMWTGYYMTIKGFEYIGCVKIAEREADFESHLNAPGICHSTCNDSNIIGIDGEKCFCLHNESFVNATQPFCDKLCDTQAGIVCGGHKLMSLYKLGNVTGVISDDHIENSCLGLEFQHVSKIFRWQNCGDHLRPLCIYVDSESNSGDKQFPWNTASNECFKQQRIPASYKTALEFKTVLTGIYWTGTIRSQTIHEYNGTLEEGGHIRFGYLTKNDNNVTVVSFSRDNKILKGLCKLESTKERKSAGQIKSSVPSSAIIVPSIMVSIAVPVGLLILYRRKLKQLRQAVMDRYRSEQTEYITPILKDGDTIYTEEADIYEETVEWTTEF